MNRALVSILATLTLMFSNIGRGSNTVDLGDINVAGEVRKPSIAWIDSQKAVKDQLPDIFKNEFAEFEAELLKPAVLDSEKSGEINVYPNKKKP
ncbi:MAG: hypothetical protein HQK53_14250 [Oligoflexia bacterium]|nr:hypothetical protein [Oligoflexia bacterium]